MKLVCYIQCGMGDFYDLISILPDFIKKRNIDQIKFYIDSVYFVRNGFDIQKDSSIKMIETITKDWEVVPENLGSYNQLYYGNENRELGPQYNKIKNTFMFYRRQETINYIKSKISNDDIFLYSIMGINFTFEWRDGVNIPLIEYKREPLSFPLHKDIVEIMDGILNKYNVFLHVRKKGKSETDNYFHELHKVLINKGLSVFYVGLDGMLMTDVKCFNYLSFEWIMYLIENIKYMVCSSSMFGCHRIHFNKKTIINTPYRNGSNEIIFKDYIVNPNYLFLNSEVDNLNLIREEVSTWK